MTEYLVWSDQSVLLQAAATATNTVSCHRWEPVNTSQLAGDWTISIVFTDALVIWLVVLCCVNVCMSMSAIIGEILLAS